jgi:hypothetical protein
LCLDKAHLPGGMVEDRRSLLQVVVLLMVVVLLVLVLVMLVGMRLRRLRLLQIVEAIALSDRRPVDRLALSMTQHSHGRRRQNVAQRGQALPKIRRCDRTGRRGEKRAPALGD